MISYPRFTPEMKSTHKILIPNMAPVQFRILAAAMEREGYTCELLENCGSEVCELGLKYVHNDTCYPALLVIGQFLDALSSGKYDLDHTALIITQTGGGCRASNYIHLLRKALVKAGYPQVPVVSLNFSGLEKDSGFPMTVPFMRKLLATIYYGTAEDLRELIQLGADVNTVTDGGTNLLHHAANSLSPWPEQEKKMEEVLKHGPDVNAVSLNGHTPLLSAAIRFFEKKAPFGCVELLVQAGADVRVRHNNTTLLHVAAASGQPEMLSLLLKAGASATEADDNGNTPLAYAYLLSRKLRVPRATRNKIIHLLLAAAPELKKKLTTLKRRYWFNKLLNFILLLVVLRFLWLLLS